MVLALTSSPILCSVSSALKCRYCLGYAHLLNALKSSLGVSLCIRTLLRLLLPPEASTAFRRCCNARIACGVVGAPLLAEPTRLVLALAVGVRAVGVCAAAEPGVRTYILLASVGVPPSLFGVRCFGVLGLCMM